MRLPCLRTIPSLRCRRDKQPALLEEHDFHEPRLFQFRNSQDAYKPHVASNAHGYMSPRKISSGRGPIRCEIEISHPKARHEKLHERQICAQGAPEASSLPGRCRSSFAVSFHDGFVAARGFRAANRPTAAGLACHCQRRIDSDPCAHRDWQDPHRIPVVHRQIDVATAASGIPRLPRHLYQPVESPRR